MRCSQSARVKYLDKGDRNTFVNFLWHFLLNCCTSDHLAKSLIATVGLFVQRS